MIKFIKRTTSHLARGRAGRRFITRYTAQRALGHGMLRHSVVLSVGVFVFALGIVLVPAPGPGMLIMLVGATLIAQESRVVAMKLDRAEICLRKSFGKLRRFWRRKAGTGTKVALAATAVCLVGGVAFGAAEVLQN